jgi:hypothetical protein
MLDAECWMLDTQCWMLIYIKPSHKEQLAGKKIGEIFWNKGIPGQ